MEVNLLDCRLFGTKVIHGWGSFGTTSWNFSAIFRMFLHFWKIILINNIYRLTHPSLNWVFDQGCQQIYFSFIGSLIQPKGLSFGWCWLFQRYIWSRVAHTRANHAYLWRDILRLRLYQNKNKEDREQMSFRFVLRKNGDSFSSLFFCAHYSKY